MSNYIHSKDITVVIQGPLFQQPKSEKHNGINQSLPSIRKYFPDAEVIISTWTTEDTSNINVDKIIKSDDVGGFPDTNKSTRNFNRQLVSTFKGIEQATRPYVLKTRADIVFTSAEIAQVSEHRKGSLLKQPITLTNMVFRNHFKIPFLFHLSDVVQFGLKQDMTDLWSIPKEEIHEIETNGKENVFFRYSSSCFKYFPEQSLCIRWLKKYGIKINLRSPTDISLKFLWYWEVVLYSNFHIINYEQSGIVFPIHFHTSAYGNSTLMKSEDINLKKIKATNNLSVEGWIIHFKYARLWLVKYVLGFTNKTFFLAVMANVLYVFFPSLNQRLFTFWRKIRPR